MTQWSSHQGSSPVKQFNWSSSSAAICQEFLQADEKKFIEKEVLPGFSSWAQNLDYRLPPIIRSIFQLRGNILPLSCSMTMWKLSRSSYIGFSVSMEPVSTKFWPAKISEHLRELYAHDQTPLLMLQSCLGPLTHQLTSSQGGRVTCVSSTPEGRKPIVDVDDTYGSKYRWYNSAILE
ncbi:hypothetical protein MPTK1_4g03390 [Marchantia polymorpha subsp. ruderalis]|uniref:Uncharacterized protein n=2 Tax=Marchantia polymorpha TaxID=3197 RepID=A0AAF6B5U5_MARPO|nr:hypothetical protein MARPO_0044s0134 [Marchantia polymorpha]BBN07379.1 hypothetical protein Mp_4g03390 [Marchantia polymorpha subsp. ruderalis]|eukprot:PTQ39721.1 hypothetical protein MARPO_0044s0134 [Marchantia polymorpha]